MSQFPEYQYPSDAKELLTRWLNRLRISQFAHNEAAKQLGLSHYLIGIPATILSTIVGTSVFASLGRTVDPSLQIAVGFVSVLAAVLAALQTLWRFSERAATHRAAAAHYASVRRRVEALLATTTNHSSLSPDIDSIRKDIDALSIESPIFPERVWKKAKTLAAES